MDQYVRFALVALVPVVLSIAVYLLDKKTAFEKIKKWVKQIIIGGIYGVFAIMATEHGVEIGGAVANTRDAAALCAGLLFGAPSGIIAGAIGGAYRWFFAAGDYTRIACSVATLFAGLFGAGCRKFMFGDKKPSWFYGLAIGMTTEVLHMLLIFLTNMTDAGVAFTFVERASLPMILGNGISVMLAMLSISLLGKEKMHLPREKKQIAQTFQFALLIVVAAAFFITSAFTYALQKQISDSNADSLLSINMNDVKADINDASNSNLLSITHRVAKEINEKTDRISLIVLADKYNVSEISIID